MTTPLTPSATTLPAIHVAGSHYAVGYAIGQTFAAQIQAMYDNYELLQERMLPYLVTTQGRQRYEALLEVQQEQFPGYMAELQGLADGSGRPFHEVFLCNARGEFSGFLAQERASQGCFDVAILSDQAAILAHNEDGTTAARGTAYLVHARVDGEAGWTAFSYPGFLCGNAFGFNRHGIAFSIDNVRPQQVRVGLVRHFLARSLLDARSIDDAIQRVTRPGRAAGFNYMIASIKERRIVGVEVAPDDYHVHPVEGTYYHANHYLHLPQVAQRIHPSSAHRLERALSLPPTTSAAEALAILGDDYDPEYPIHRTATPPDSACTLCTALFDLDRRLLSIYLGHPVRASEARIELRL